VIRLDADWTGIGLEVAAVVETSRENGKEQG